MEKTPLTLVALLVLSGLAGAQSSTFIQGTVTGGQTVTLDNLILSFAIDASKEPPSLQVTITGPSSSKTVGLLKGDSYSHTDLVSNPVRGQMVLKTVFTLQVVSLGSSSAYVTLASGLRLVSDVPGQTAEAGETVKFPLKLTNRNPRETTVDLGAERGTIPRDWTTQFKSGQTPVFKVFLASGETREVTLEVSTTGETPLGDYTLYAAADQEYFPLSVKITRTFQGERGTATATLQDSRGQAVSGVEVRLLRGSNVTARANSGSDGRVRLEAPVGKYTLSVEGTGMRLGQPVEADIRAGKSVDLGTLRLEPQDYYVSIAPDASSKSASAKEGGKFTLKLRNQGIRDETLDLGVAGLPAAWSYVYRESDKATEEVRRVSLAAGQEREVVLLLLPPPGLTGGSVNLTATLAGVGGRRYEANLSLDFRGRYDMALHSPRGLAVTTGRGTTADIDLGAFNTGDAGSLTNLVVEAETPQGWTVSVEPRRVATLAPGSSAQFKVRVTPPGDLSPGDYKVTLKAKSDQVERSESYRVTLQAEAGTVALGVMAVLVVVGLLGFVFWKYGRR
ncbi:MAG: hypothetical protein HY558_08380 [Euryarchaeota archaeon]|nr:hypothetical protein [Euryarchaeota archaeon]